MSESIEDQVNEYVAQHGLKSNERIELITGDGWTLQLVGDGYFGDQYEGPNYSMCHESISTYDNLGTWVCNRTKEHPGPHVAMAGQVTCAVW